MNRYVVYTVLPIFFMANSAYAINCKEAKKEVRNLTSEASVLVDYANDNFEYLYPKKFTSSDTKKLCEKLMKPLSQAEEATVKTEQALGLGIKTLETSDCSDFKRKTLINQLGAAENTSLSAKKAFNKVFKEMEKLSCGDYLK